MITREIAIFCTSFSIAFVLVSAGTLSLGGTQPFGFSAAYPQCALHVNNGAWHKTGDASWSWIWGGSIQNDCGYQWYNASVPAPELQGGLLVVVGDVHARHIYRALVLQLSGGQVDCCTEAEKPQWQHSNLTHTVPSTPSPSGYLTAKFYWAPTALDVAELMGRLQVDDGAWDDAAVVVMVGMWDALHRDVTDFAPDTRRIATSVTRFAVRLSHELTRRRRARRDRPHLSLWLPLRPTRPSSDSDHSSDLFSWPRHKPLGRSSSSSSSSDSVPLADWHRPDRPGRGSSDADSDSDPGPARPPKMFWILPGSLPLSASLPAGFRHRLGQFRSDISRSGLVHPMGPCLPIDLRALTANRSRDFMRRDRAGVRYTRLVYSAVAQLLLNSIHHWSDRVSSHRSHQPSFPPSWSSQPIVLHSSPSAWDEDIDWPTTVAAAIAIVVAAAGLAFARYLYWLRKVASASSSHPSTIPMAPMSSSLSPPPAPDLCSESGSELQRANSVTSSSTVYHTLRRTATAAPASPHLHGHTASHTAFVPPSSEKTPRSSLDRSRPSR